MKRYEPDTVPGGGVHADAPCMTEDPDGDWVRLSDLQQGLEDAVPGGWKQSVFDLLGIPRPALTPLPIRGYGMTPEIAAQLLKTSLNGKAYEAIIEAALRVKFRFEDDLECIVIELGEKFSEPFRWRLDVTIRYDCDGHLIQPAREFLAEMSKSLRQLGNTADGESLLEIIVVDLTCFEVWRSEDS